MSLVDYDDSSSDEEKEAPPKPQQKPNPTPNRKRSGSSLNQQEENVQKLPDALSLLESPTLTQVSGSGNDHASVVAAAMAENALRKRDLNGSSTSLPRRPKVPRGNMPHSKNIPETLSNVLVPPQLKGRSNVATEDMSKLFVKKRQDSSKAGSPNQE